MQSTHPVLSNLKFLLIVLTVMTGLAACEPGAPAENGESQDDLVTNSSLSPLVQPTPTRTPLPEMPEFSDSGTISIETTQSAVDALRIDRVLTVGALYNAPPLSYMADNGQIKGFEADLVTAMASQWGIDVEFRQVTHQTRFQALQTGEVDVLIGAVPHAREYESSVLLTDTVFFSGLAVITSEGGSESLDEIMISGDRLGVISNGDRDRLIKAIGEIQVEVYPDYDTAVDALLNGEITAVAGQREQVMRYAVKDGIQLLDEMIVQDYYSFAARFGDSPLRDLLNLTLHELIKSGVVGELYSENFYGLLVDRYQEVGGLANFDFDSIPTALGSSSNIRERLRQRGALVVTGFRQPSEYGRFDSQQVVDGFNRAVINEMARRWGVGVVEMSSTTEPQGYDLLISGQADILVGIQPDLSLYGAISLSQPYYSRGIGIVHLEDVTMYGISDLSYRPVVVVTPTELGTDLVDRNTSFTRVTTETDLETAFQLLQSRGVYAMVGDEFTVTLVASADERIRIVPERYRVRNYGMAVSYTEPEILSLINITLQDMYSDGTLSRLTEQYLAPYRPEMFEVDPVELEVWQGSSAPLFDLIFGVEPL